MALLLPWREIGNVPEAAEDATAKLSVALLPAATSTAAEVTPVGRPLGVTVTVPVNPFCAATVTWTPPELPGAMFSVEGDAERMKSGVGGGGVVVGSLLPP